MALAIASISRCYHNFHPLPSPSAQFILRPVARVTTRFAVTRPTNTPLCGSRKACSLSNCLSNCLSSSCELLFAVPVQANRSYFAPRISAYSQQRARLTTSANTRRGLYQLCCTRTGSGSSNYASIETAQRHWPLVSLSHLSHLSHASNRHFSTSYPTMTAVRLDGTAIAKKIRERLAAEIVEKQKSNPKYQPCLKIIQGL